MYPGRSNTQPPIAPITFSIDTNGVISVHGDATAVTPLGEFSLEAGAFKTIKPGSSSILVVIRHTRDGQEIDAAYTVDSSEQLSVTLDGHIQLTITNRKVFIDASAGKVRSIKIATAGSAGSGNTHAGGNVLLDDPLTASGHASYQSSLDSFQSDGYHITGDFGQGFMEPYSFGNADVSVEVRWLRGDRGSATFGFTFRDIYTFTVNGDGYWSIATFGGADLVSPTFNSAIHAGKNYLRVVMEGPEVKYYANGNLLGESNDRTRLSGAVGFYAYGGNNTNNEVVFNDLLVTKVP